MKKIILILMLLTAASPGVSAQKWLKNVGKALEKVDKFLDTSTTSTSSSSSKKTSDKKSTTKGIESQYGDVTLTNAITGVNVTYKGAVRTAPDKGVIDLLFLNSGNEDIIIYDLKSNITIFDTEGNQYTDYTVLLGNDHTTWGGYRFRAGIPTRVKLQVEGLPASQEITIHTAKFQSSLKSDGSESNPLDIHNVVFPVYDSQLAERAAKGFPEKCQWQTTTSEEKNIIIDLNTADKEFMLFDIKTHGFIIVKDLQYGGKQVNTIDDVKVNGNSAKLKFTNYIDYNTYGGTLTFNPTDGSVTLSGLEMLEKSEFNKFLMNIPDEPIKFTRASSPLEYSTEIYE